MKELAGLYVPVPRSCHVLGLCIKRKRVQVRSLHLKMHLKPKVIAQ